MRNQSKTVLPICIINCMYYKSNFILGILIHKNETSRMFETFLSRGSEKATDFSR